MNVTDAVEVLARVESEVDVNRPRHRGVHLWPLIRLVFFHRLLEEQQAATSMEGDHPVGHPPASTPLRRYGEHVYQGASALPGALAAWRALRSRRRPVLFVSRGEAYLERTRGGVVDRVLDPVAELSRRQAPARRLHASAPVEGQAWEGPTLDAERLTRLARVGVRARELLQPPDSGDLYPVLNQALADTGVTRRMSSESLTEPIRQLASATAVWRTVLRAVEPQAVFLACYYNVEGMALVRACREAGVPAVDVQHGKQGRFHGMYTHWSRVPEAGYDLLPDYFWLWGEESKRNIARWLPEHGPHQPVVGGNLWLAGWRAGRWSAPSEETTALYADLDECARVVLVSLQPLAEPLSDVLLRAMSNSPPGWRWLVRLHPRQRQDEAILATRLRERGVTGAEIARPTRAPLYELLARVDHHVTEFSSVCYEALSFGVPTSILGATGRRLYQDYLEQGLFLFAEDAPTLLAQIRDPEPVREGERAPYIETREDLALRALRRILGSGSRR